MTTTYSPNMPPLLRSLWGNQIGTYLPNEEFVKICHEVKSGTMTNVERLMASIAPLIISRCRKLNFNYSDYEDAFSSCAEYIITACHRFDPINFNPDHCKSYIIGCVMMELSTLRCYQDTVRMSVVNRKLQQRVMNHLRGSHLEARTWQEKVDYVIQNSDIDPDDVYWALSNTIHHVSISHASRYDDSDSDHLCLDDYYHHDNHEPHHRKQAMEALLSTLDEKEQTFIQRHYGLAEYDPMSYQKIADALNIKRFHVKKAVPMILKELKHRARKANLEFQDLLPDENASWSI